MAFVSKGWSTGDGLEGGFDDATGKAIYRNKSGGLIDPDTWGSYAGVTAPAPKANTPVTPGSAGTNAPGGAVPWNANPGPTQQIQPVVQAQPNIPVQQPAAPAPASAQPAGQNRWEATAAVDAQGGVYARDKTTGENVYADKFGNITRDGGKTWTGNTGGVLPSQIAQDTQAAEQQRRRRIDEANAANGAFMPGGTDSAGRSWDPQGNQISGPRGPVPIGQSGGGGVQTGRPAVVYNPYQPAPNPWALPGSGQYPDPRSRQPSFVGGGTFGRQWGVSEPGKMYSQVEGPGNPSWEARHPEANPALRNQYNPYGPDPMGADPSQYPFPYGGQVGSDQGMVWRGGAAPTGAADWSRQLQQMVQTAMGARPVNQDLDAYRKAMPNPNQVVARNYYRMPTSSRDFMLGTYEAMGYDPNDVEETISRTTPTWRVPRAGMVR